MLSRSHRYNDGESNTTVNRTDLNLNWVLKVKPILQILEIIRLWLIRQWQLHICNSVHTTIQPRQYSCLPHSVHLCGKNRHPWAALAAAVFCEGNSNTCVRKKGVPRALLNWYSLLKTDLTELFLRLSSDPFAELLTNKTAWFFVLTNKKIQELPLLLFKKVENKIFIFLKNMFFACCQTGYLSNCVDARI